MKTKFLIPIILVTLVAAFLLGRSTSSEKAHPHNSSVGTGEAAAQAEFWTCAMHPQIKQPGPGKCPICAMELVPVFKNSQASLGPNQIELSAGAIAIAGVRTTPVIRAMPTVEVRMVGKVDFDETKLSYITARFPGRLDRLFVDYTGVRVNKGDHLVEIYSPALLAAQEELLQTISTARELKGSSNALLRDRTQEMVQAARDKLLLWDLKPEQVAAIEEKGKISDRLTLYAPSSGIVIRKEAVDGKYVQTGAPIYTIANLNHVWVQLDAYESDLVWLHFGQEVEFTSAAYPGQVFAGRIAFIDPVLNPKTRTVRVRVNMENPGGKLKPEMFVNAVVRSQVVSDGKVMNPELAGKWISPMHPEIVSDEPGDCSVCGMALVSAESLGYLPGNVDESAMPLLIPASAPLITGKRAVVYLAAKDQPGVFEGRVIELGPRAGDQYIVKSGLEEGDLVVSHGAFKIDSAVQILAKPSMMNPAEDHSGHGEAAGVNAFQAPAEFQQQVRAIVEAYVPVTTALSQDNLDQAKKLAPALKSAVKATDMKLLVGDAHSAWMKELTGINEGIEALLAAADLDAGQKSLELVSIGLINSAEAFGIGDGDSVYVYHCPMAFKGEGADWIQNKQGTENPYFGSKMFSCGDETRELEWKGAKAEPTQRPTGDGDHKH